MEFSPRSPIVVNDPSDPSGWSSPPTIPPSSGYVEQLKQEVKRLRDELNEVEAERDELLEQNRQLRQEATVVRLYEDLARTRRETDDGPPSTGATLAERVYQSLPRTLTVREFFSYADEQGLDTTETRECLVYFLKNEMMSQAGPRLEKTGPLLRRVRLRDEDTSSTA